MTARAKPYFLKEPWNAQKIEQLDEMLGMIFDDLRNGNLEIDLSQIITGLDVGDILYINEDEDLDGLAIGAAGTVLISDGILPGWGLVNLTTSVTGILPIANGGTGANTALGAFNNLSPLTTKGDLLTHNGTNNIRLGVGTNGQVLTANSAVAAGVEWAVGGGGSSTHDLLSLTHPDTFPGSPVAGDLIYAKVTGELADPSVFGGGGYFDGEDVQQLSAGRGAFSSYGDGTSDDQFLNAFPPSIFSTALWDKLPIGSERDFLSITSGQPAWVSAISLTADVSGILPVANGGTGQSTALAAFNALSPLTDTGDLLSFSVSNNVRIAAVATGSVLASAGASTLPVWSTAPTISGANITALNAGNISSGTLAVARGGTGVSTFGGTNRLLYTTATDTLASITTANSSVLLTNGSGVPAWSTGPILLADGSAAAPTYSFSGDTNTGLYHTASVDQIGLSAGGSVQLLVSSTSIDFNNDLLPFGTATYDLGESGVRWRDLWLSDQIHERGRTTALGEWTTVSFNSGDFTADTGTWTVASGDLISFKYTLVGKTMYVVIVIEGSSVSGSPNFLQVAVPGGFTPVGTNVFTTAGFDNLTPITAFCSTTSTLIRFRLSTLATWATSTDNTYNYAAIFFEIS